MLASAPQGKVESALDDLLPLEVRNLANPQKDLPRIARDPALMKKLEQALLEVTTRHDLYLADSRSGPELPPNSVHLVITSPPYWTLKEYNECDGQLGYIADYEAFLVELDRVWDRCFHALAPGGRLVCVVGDVCLSRKKNDGRHMVVPLHASIQEHCRTIGFDNLAPIIWYKIANAAYEVEGGGGKFLGKPYEPNAIVKNDIEFILMQRKPGSYRSPSLTTRLLSLISAENHALWFQQIWQGVTGASTRQHPAPFPVELASRLIRMFSFVGDTVLDPFMGTATTQVAAAKLGRNSIGIEVDPKYFGLASNRLQKEVEGFFNSAAVVVHDGK